LNGILCKLTSRLHMHGDFISIVNLKLQLNVFIKTIVLLLLLLSFTYFQKISGRSSLQISLFCYFNFLISFDWF
jgi:hypothetical protein